MPQIAWFRGALAGAPRDASRALYRYHQVFDAGGRPYVRKQLVAAIKLAPPSDGSIRPTEATPAAARDAELARLRAERTSIEPVLAGYRDAAGEVNHQLKPIDAARPHHEDTTADGVIHRVWRVTSAEIFGELRKRFAPKKLHVLAGHARYDAALAYAGELDAARPLSMYSSAGYALACLVELGDPALHVVASRRALRGAAEPGAVLAAAQRYFLIDKLAGAGRDPAAQAAALAGDTIQHQPAFVVAFAGDGDAYKLTLKPDVNVVGEGVAVARAVQRFDAIVADRLFARCAPGASWDGDGAPVAEIVTRAPSIDQLTTLGDHGEVLPAGSFAAPPAIAALVRYSIDPDDDLL